MAGSLMAREMAEQPEVLSRLAADRPQTVEALRVVLPDAPAGLVLAARGSSDHAAVYGRYLLEAHVGRPVALAAPSLVTRYGRVADHTGWVAGVISQSGRTPELLTVAERFREAGAVIVAVTNDADAPLATAADAVIELRAGQERAVPATKTVMAQLAAFGVLAEALGASPWSQADWDRLPAAVQEVLDDPTPAERVAADLADALGLVTVGRGYLYAVALEAALKLKETIALLAQGYAVPDLRHGPIAVVERDFPALVFDAPGPVSPDVAELRDELAGRGARIIRCDPGPGAQLPVPGGLPEELAGLPALARAQQLTVALALTRGLDPDTPFGLRKVTMTR